MGQTSPIDARGRAAVSTLEGQLRDIYGRAAYTQKTHEKMADRCIAKYRRIKRLEIALSALTLGSLLVAVFGESRTGTIVGGEQAQKHGVVGTKLWGVREALLSLLVDMHDGRSISEIRAERDRLTALLEEIYRAAPRTDSAAYSAAQRALKRDEELFFTDEELDRMLPVRLRSGAATSADAEPSTP
jgi:hypothetical protein